MFTSERIRSHRFCALALALAMLLSLLVPAAALSEPDVPAEAVAAEIVAEEPPAEEPAAEEPGPQIEEPAAAPSPEPASDAVVEEEAPAPDVTPDVAEPEPEPEAVPEPVETEPDATAEPTVTEPETAELPEPSQMTETAEIGTDENLLSRWHGVSLERYGNPLRLELNSGVFLIEPDFRNITPASWTMASLNTDVVEISGDRLVPVGIGAAVVTLTCDDPQYKATLNVLVFKEGRDFELQIRSESKKNEILATESVKLWAYLYDSVTKYEMTPIYSEDEPLIWESSNTDVAAIGVHEGEWCDVLAKNAGTATITVTDINGLKGSFNVTVKALDKPYFFGLDVPDVIGLIRGAPESPVHKATCQIDPLGTSDGVPYNIEWTTSDPSIIEIRDNTDADPNWPAYYKYLVGKQPGRATITIKCGELEVSKVVEVVDTDHVWTYLIAAIGTHFTTDFSEPIEITPGETVIFDVNVTPDDSAILPPVTWGGGPAGATAYAHDYYSRYSFTMPDSGTYNITASVEGSTEQYTATIVAADRTITSISFSDNDETNDYYLIRFVLREVPLTWQIEAYVHPLSVDVPIVWTTKTGAQYATIDDNGLVTFNSNLAAELLKTKGWVNGSSTRLVFTGTAGGKSVDAIIEIAEDTIPQSIKLDRFGTITHDIKDGDTLTLEADVQPHFNFDPPITWKSSAPTVAKVEADGKLGKVTFLKAGKATITATTSNKKSASVTINVVDTFAPTAVQLSTTGTITIKVDQIWWWLDAKLLPYATDTLPGAQSAVTWTASGKTKDKKEVVSFVDEEDAPIASASVVSPFEASPKVVKFIGVNPGTAKITAKTSNGKSATLTVNVVAANSAKFASYMFNIHLNGDEPAVGAAMLLEEKLTAIVDEEFDISFEAHPEGTTADAPVINWSVKGAAITQHATNKNHFTAANPGKATITAAYGKIKKTWTINVIPNEGVSSFALDISGTKEMQLGQKLTIDYLLIPTTDTNYENTPVTWTSSKKDVANFEADPSNALIAKKVGTTVVTATIGTGKAKKTAKVTIKVIDASKPGAVRLNYSGTKEIAKGGSFQLIAELSPAGSASELKFTSAKPSIAAVNEKTGVVTAGNTVGSTTITVTTANKKTAKVTVKVYDPLVPTAVALPYSSLTLGVGEYNDICYRIILTPASALTSYTWKSSSPKKVGIDQNGVIWGVAKGTSTITVSTSNGKKYSMKVTVK